jgi:hypothetical protein
MSPKFPAFIKIQFLVGLLSVTYAHFRWNVVSVDPSVISNTLVDLLRNLNSCYSRWPPRKSTTNTRPRVIVSVRTFVNFHLATDTELAFCGVPHVPIVSTQSHHKNLITNCVSIGRLHVVNGAAHVLQWEDIGSCKWRMFMLFSSVLPTSLLSLTKIALTVWISLKLSLKLLTAVLKNLPSSYTWRHVCHWRGGPVFSSSGRERN